MATDPISVVVGVLAADSGVSALAGGNVFGGELDQAIKAMMPAAAVVVTSSGGSSNLGGGYLPFGDGRLDAICYGATPLEAYNVWDAVLACLTGMRKHGRVHWANHAGGPMQFRDPATDWPIARGSFQVLANQL